MAQNNLKILIGCDPEAFVRNKKTGEFVSAHTMIPGTKYEPHKVPEGAVQVDGVAAEFNIDPCATPQEFSHRITLVGEALQGFIGDDFELKATPTVEFPAEYFKSLPEKVRELGCDPDFNAWTGQVNEKPNGSKTMRTGAGHIHIGWGKDMDPTDPTNFSDCCIVAKQLDYYIGLQSLKWDKDTKRRSLYGKAGAFRPKPYGIEYRTLSNVWLRSPQLQRWLFGASVKAFTDLVQNGQRLDEIFGDVAERIINGSETWWTKSGIEKSPEYKKLFEELPKYTRLNDPPSLPKEAESDDESKVVVEAKGKKIRGKRFFSGNIYGLDKDGFADLKNPIHVTDPSSLSGGHTGTPVSIPLEDIEIVGE